MFAVLCTAALVYAVAKWRGWIDGEPLYRPLGSVLLMGFCSAMALGSVVATPSGVASQTIELTPVADLLGGEALNLTDPPRRGPLVPLPAGGWLYAGHLEGWAWGEFGPDGSLVRVAGKEWIAGGPGEFRDVRAVFPLTGDTLLVLEPYMAHRVLRQGTYIDTRPIPFNPARYWVRHDGQYWLSGPSSRGAGMPLLRVTASGDLDVFRIPARGTEEQLLGAQPVSWAGELWLWEYPHGPLRRIDESSGEVMETWDAPIGDDRIDTWRAFAVTGPDDTIVFRIDPTFEWVVLDARREKLLSQTIPEQHRTVYFIDAEFGIGYAFANEPVRYAAGIRVFRYRIMR